MCPSMLHIDVHAHQVTRLVFRTHHYADLMAADNVHYLPLGAGSLLTDVLLGFSHHTQLLVSKTIIADETQSFYNRSWLCSFAGSMKYKSRGNTFESSRVEMVQVLQEVPGCVFFPTDDVSLGAPLSQLEYVQLAGSTLFSLCPRGVGPETNR